MSGRFTDVHNYLFIMESMLQARHKEDQSLQAAFAKMEKASEEYLHDACGPNGLAAPYLGGV